MIHANLAPPVLVLLVVFTSSGCRLKREFGGGSASSIGMEDGSAEELDGSPATTMPEPTVDATPPGLPAGSACSIAAECASHFCIDAVCCDSACTVPCHSCDQAVARGTCLPFYGGTDEIAIPPCLGIRTCAVDPAFPPSCALVDGQECERDSDCASAHCRAYYLDHDNDGYGAIASVVRHCDATPNAPAGYVTQAGDCCDVDPGANPAVPATTFFSTADACGSFDWNCSGAAELQPGLTCPVGSPLSCGQKCLGPFNTAFFTQPCH